MSQDKLKSLYMAIKHKLDDYEKKIFMSILEPESKFDPIAGTGGSPDYPKFHATNNSGNNINVFEEGTYSSYSDDNSVNVFRGLNSGFTNSFEQQT